ncbi:hypothetical protein D1BOALGB6SA_6270 [Olavius sp. associated proteobacterium Delta 1]|nr:hypothetical protein D1BOALGB6SA_6270 [Olavius sp. associated proteobacterium Delta 1]
MFRKVAEQRAPVHPDTRHRYADILSFPGRQWQALHHTLPYIIAYLWDTRSIKAPFRINRLACWDRESRYKNRSMA